MNLREIREAREFAQYLMQLSADLDEAGRTSTGEDVNRAAAYIERMGRALSKSRTTVTAVRKALKEHAA